MVSDKEFNAVVRQYNHLLNRKTTLTPNELKEVHKSEGEAISISSDGIALSSNKISVEELSNLMIQMLENKTIKNFLDMKKIEKMKKEITYLG